MVFAALMLIMFAICVPLTISVNYLWGIPMVLLYLCACVLLDGSLLRSSYDSLCSSYDSLRSSYDSLHSNYDSLRNSCESLCDINLSLVDKSSILLKYAEAMGHVHNHSGELSDEVKIYSSSTRANLVGVPIADVIKSFICKLHNRSTVLMVNIDHTDGSYGVDLAGEPIHIVQLNEVCNLVNSHINEIAGNDDNIILCSGDMNEKN
jgi:hypothetical protein